MTDEQKVFLNDKLTRLAVEQPEILILRTRLLAISGVQLVAPTKPDPDLSALLDRGVQQIQNVRLERQERNGCHSNTSALWREDRLTAISTGYALSEDGLWRQHSWGNDNDGIVETTEVRTHYFGISLCAEDADKFASLYP